MGGAICLVWWVVVSGNLWKLRYMIDAAETVQEVG